MDTGLNASDLEKFKTFIETCKKTPEILWIPELKFFREFIESLGGSVPEPKEKSSKEEESTTSAPEPEKMDDSAPAEAESDESDLDLDNDGVLEPETQDFPEMGDSSKVVSEEDEIAAGEKRSEAMAAMSDGDLEKAVELFTEAIKLNPSSAMMYAKRANILLKQKRIKAAISDCDEAVRLNPDSATAHKFRGRAFRLLGQWLDAAKELRLACKLDFDEQTHEWLKEVEPNALKIEEHNRKYERKKQEKIQTEKMERIRKAREEHKKAQERQEQQQSQMPGGFPGMPGGFPGFPGGMPGGMPGGFPGGMPGGMPGGFPGGMPGAAPGGGGASGMPNFGDLLNDPDLLKAMEDPDVAAAFQDVSKNPSNIFKYKDNPKVSTVINKLMTKFGGAGAGFPGGAPGGCPAGFGGDSSSKFSDAPSNDDLD